MPIITEVRSAFALALQVLVTCVWATDASGQVTVKVDWDHGTGKVKTTLTIQECPEPPLLPGHPLHDAAMKRLRELKAEDARIQFWHPYPLLGVPELYRPDPSHAVWNFALADEALLDFYKASEGRPVMVNFSTLPGWMFKNVPPFKVPGDPDTIDWSYNRGRELEDESLRELTGYFKRIAQWYIAGGFRDENGNEHNSGYHLKFAYWEVLNEIEEEHMWSPEMYARIYDAVVQAVAPVDPAMHFSALALANPAASLNFIRYFLTPSNHRAGTPLDMISYHFYIAAKTNEDMDSLQTLFYQRADDVLKTVGSIESIRKSLSPGTKTYINELGTMWMDGKKADGPAIPARYWGLSSAVFAYTYLGLIRQGIDLVGSAELIDYPGQYAGTSLLNWETGDPFPRYYVTEELIRQIHAGDRLFSTEVSSDTVSALAVGSGRRHVIVLVNKLHTEQVVKLPGFHAQHLSVVGLESGAPHSIAFRGRVVQLGPDDVAFVTQGQ